MAEAGGNRPWSGRTDGLPWMQQSLVVMLRFLPLWLLYGIMALVLPFYLFFGKGFKPMYRFFRTAFGYGALKSCVYVWRNHFQFGQVVLDRFGCFAGKRYRFNMDGIGLFRKMEQEDAGFVVFSSHAGNYEMAGYALQPEFKRMHALVYAAETETIMRNRQERLSRHQIRMIPVREDLSHLFSMNAALEAGDIVSLPADRIYGSSKSVECLFFGKKADFPMGGFALAVRKRVGALAVFVMKEGYRTYRILVRPLQYDTQSGRSEQVVQLAQNYVAELESVLQRYPTQWYNYYDLWTER